MSYFSIHNHSHYSNLRLIDSITFPEQLIEYANTLGLSGISLSDHESLSGHVKFIQAYKKMKEEGKLNDNFKIAFGNEIYLVREESLDELKENYKQRKSDTQFYHFLLTALNPEGYEQLKKLSSKAWENSFRTGLMVRVPTFKKDLKDIIKGGNVVATSACLGGELPQYILKWQKAEEAGNKKEIGYYKREIHNFIQFCISVFGKDKFFFEIQPSDDEEQHVVNRKLIDLSEVYGIDYIVATDSHFLKKEDRHAHKVYLQSQEGEREVDAFYASCYVFSEEEIKESMLSHLTEEEIQTALDNTNKIHEMIEVFDLYHETIIPHANIEKFELKHLFEKYYKKYEFIEKYAYSPHEIDRYFLYLIEKGYIKYFKNKRTKYKEDEVVKRIDTELKELWLISERLGDRLSSYYVLTRQIVLEVIWDKADSICGVARGSAAGFLINYLLEIIQINPLDYNLPHFRHLTAERPELPDIDLDSEQSKRLDILEALKETFGDKHVLNIATFSREGSRSALLSACRGMGIDNDEAQFLANLIPSERGRTWTLREAFYGNERKNRKPVNELVEEVEKHEGLKEIALKIEGLVKNNSVHASGIYIFNNEYTHQNAMMKSSTGLATTQFDMKDSDYMGGLKIDALTVQNIDKIRATLDMLLKDGVIKWQGSLKETYDKYLHPEVLEYDNPEMWAMVAENSIPDLFQFDTQVGLQTAQKIKPKNVVELASANNLMRLMGDTIQPVDKYILHRDNPKIWEKEMREYKLTDEEISIIKKHLKDAHGVSDSQEEIMLMSMDERIANFSVTEANNLRKAVAKIDAEVLRKVKELFFKKGRESGNRKNILQYVWDKQIMPQSGYGFSQLHSSSYSLIALQNMNLSYKYPQVYWNTACLTVNSGANEIDSSKTTDYGRIGSAIGDMQHRGFKIGLPDINTANFSFTPDAKNNTIIFGLRGIQGIGSIVKELIDNRPYTSFDDFLTRMIDTKIVQNQQMIQLIKAGSFDSFGERKQIMKKYLRHINKPREKLTMASFNTVINLDIVPEELKLNVRFYKYRQYIQTLAIGRSNERKTKNRLFKLDDISTEFLYSYFTDSCVVDYDDKTGNPIVAEWLFDRQYQEKMEPVKKWLSKSEVVNLVNEKEFEREWKKVDGTLSEWEMDSLNFYYSGHELKNIDYKKYNIGIFNKMSETPTPVREYEYKGRKRYEYELNRIAGTVLDKDNIRHTITLLTTDGVVVVKMYRSSFSYYDRQLSKVNKDGSKSVIESSWFKRGNKLLITGFRRGNQFIPRVYRGSIYSHAIQRIDSIEDGHISLVSSRTTVH